MNTDQVIKDVINKMVNDGFMFTAFDATRMVRTKIGCYISHGEVKTVLQDSFNNGEMATHVRDLINVGVGIKPWLYYHPYSNISDYDANWIYNNPKQDGMKADVSVCNTACSAAIDLDDDAGDVDDAIIIHVGTLSEGTIPVDSVRLGKNEHRTTKEGRLNIPVDMVAECGFKPYQSVYVDNLNDTLFISNLGGYNSFVIGVTGDGRIRICHTILSEISHAPKSETYKVERDCNVIVVNKV